MKALSLQALGRLEMVELDLPSIEEDELLIELDTATICTSDLQDIEENSFGMSFPVVLGHEGAGTVVGVGDAASNFKIGDRIAAHPVHSCRTCSTCLNGLEHLCPNMKHFGLNMQGTFAQFFVVREDRARLIPPDMDFAAAALLEPICVSLEALVQAKLSPDCSLLIIGDGPFGIMIARLAQRFSVRNVVVAGHHDHRLAFAHNAYGVNVRAADNAGDLLLEANGNDHFERAIVAVPTAHAVEIGLNVLKPRGRLVIFAPMPGGTPVDLFRVLTNELEIVGSVNDSNLMDEALDALKDPGLDLGQLVTHTFDLDAYHDAFALARNRQSPAMKIALTAGSRQRLTQEGHQP